MTGTDARDEIVPGERGFAQSLGRAGAILDALVAGRRSGLRFTDIVVATGLSKATVHRLLSAMSAHGLVASSSDRARFHLGHRLAAWGAAARDRHGLLEIADPHLTTLAARTGDTVYLCVRAGPLSLCVAHREGTQPIRVLPLKPGDRNALGVGSASLALLAFLPDGDIDRILADPEHLRARDERGVSEAEIRALVREARKRDYAFVLDLIPGIAAVGMPVPAGDAAPVAAVAVAAIASRLEGGLREDALAALRDTTRAIGELVDGHADLPVQADRVQEKARSMSRLYR